MDELINKIMDELTKQVNEVKWVDWDFGQLEMEEKPPIRFPCVLLDIEVSEWEQFRNGSERGKADITVKVAFQNYTHTNAAMPQGMRAVGMANYAVLKKIHKVLKGMGLYRYSSKTRLNRVGTKEYGVFYKTTITEK